MKRAYSSHKSNAKRRGLASELSYEQFRELKLGDCHYCGVSSMLLKHYCEALSLKTPYMTLDRLNNSKGYVEGNVVSSCFLCNKTKGELLTAEDMMEIGAKYIRPKIEAVAEEAIQLYSDWCNDQVLLVRDDEFYDKREIGLS